MSRGFTDVAVIWPKLASPTFVAGFKNCGWLKVLKNSVRNSKLCASFTLNVLASDMSQLFSPGPSTVPSPSPPYPVGGGVPVPTACGAQNTPVLFRYPGPCTPFVCVKPLVTLDVRLPDVSMLALVCPGQSVASATGPPPLVKIVPSLLSVITSGVPSWMTTTPDQFQPLVAKPRTPLWLPKGRAQP